MSIGNDLLRFSDRKLLIFDGECQRVNLLEDNRPFQWSWLVAQRNKVIESHNHYLKWPDYRMSADAARITRFHQHWVTNGDDPTEILDKWESLALNPDYLLLGHNILAFDCPLWNLWRRELGRKTDWSMLPRIIDTHLLSRAYKEGWKPDRTNLLAWQYKVMEAHRKGIKTNLTAMAKELDVDFDEDRMHDGLYDIGVNLQVYWKLINILEI